MGRACILGSILFFILSVLFLALSLHLFSLSISIITKYRTVSYIDMISFLVDSYTSLVYLLLAVFMLLVSGVLLYGSIAVSCRCING
jgi:hypothetical protein